MSIIGVRMRVRDLSRGGCGTSVASKVISFETQNFSKCRPNSILGEVPKAKP